MGNQKQKWTPEEEEALLAGVAKYGHGRWKNIINDPEFALSLSNRSNIDLKDKWRNLSVSAGGQSRERSRAHKTKSSVVSKNPNIRNSNIAASSPSNVSSDAVLDDPSNSTQDGKSTLRYNGMIFEALSTMKDVNGSDIGAILNFIEKRDGTPLPPNFRKLLSGRLRRLVLQGKLEKVQNGYKIRKESPMETQTPSLEKVQNGHKIRKETPMGKQTPSLEKVQNGHKIRKATPMGKQTPSLEKAQTGYKIGKETPMGTKTPSPKQKVIRPQQSKNSGLRITTESQHDVADTAAYNVADAENKSFLAAEAVREAERISRMAEDTKCMLQLMTEIYKQCSRGELVHLA